VSERFEVGQRVTWLKMHRPSPAIARIASQPEHPIAFCAWLIWMLYGASGPPVLAAVAIRINLAESRVAAGGTNRKGARRPPEVVETTGYLEWGSQTNGSSGSSGGLCD
jgi:hypothetical protein